LLEPDDTFPHGKSYKKLRVKMFPLNKEQIQSLNETDLKTLAELDSKGLFPASRETLEEFKARLENMTEKLDEFDRELEKEEGLELFNCLKLHASDRINDEIMREAEQVTDEAYSFAIDWVPGFFLSRNIGILWGGCAISFPENFLSVFLIRKSFANKRRWFIYDRLELLSHELCHVARTPVKDLKLEEFFAYRLSNSHFRNYLGNCFRTQYDALFFILPVFILLIAQMVKAIWLFSYPSWPFWVLAMLYPAFLLIRNQLARNVFFNARKALWKFGVKNPDALLFRCHADEIKEISAIENVGLFAEWVGKNTEKELRWKIIAFRFIFEQESDDQALKEDNEL
jgi:hypothetical protein